MIILDENTRCIVQGITGKQGTFHTQGMLDYNTNILAGTTPGKGGQKFGEIDVYNSIAEAKKELDKIPTLYARKIAEAIYSLANEPRPSGCKKLVGYNDIYRIRIASYRIIYTIQDDVLIVQVIKIGSRQSVYE